VLPYQNTPHSVGFWCGTWPKNTAHMASCSRSVVLNSTPIGMIVALGVGSAAHKIVANDLWDETGFKIHVQIVQ
jgi:hypothetical protein